MQKIKYFVILLLLLSSYSCKDDTEYERDRLDNRSLQPAVMEARSFFEDYAVSVELSEEPDGLYPGNFAPDWSKAVVTADPTTVCVNVPIVSDIAYEGTFVANYDSLGAASPEVYYTAIGQKMVVAKDKQTGAFGCYIVTIVPDQANATKSSHIAARMYDNGDPATTFSGTAFFTVLGGNHYPVAAGRYLNGERYAAASWWWNADGDTQKLSKDLSELMGAIRFYARQKTMSKEWCLDVPGTQSGTGSLGPGFDGGGGGNVHIIPVCVNCDSGVANIYISTHSPQFPNTSGSNQGSTGYDYAGTYDGSNSSSGSTGVIIGYGSGASSTGNTSKSTSTPRDYVKTTGDKFFNGSVPPKGIIEMVGQTQTEIMNCLPYTMAYANRLLGGNRTPKECTDDFWIYNINAEKGVPFEIGDKGIRFNFRLKEELKSMNYRTIIDKKCVVIVSIPVPPDELNNIASSTPGAVVLSEGRIQFSKGIIARYTHSVLIVGYKANGDVIYMDPAKNKLQEVNPAYLLDKIHKYVIEKIGGFQ